MEGVFHARWRGPTLEALPIEENSAIALRIAEVVRDGDSFLYELRFVGTTPGTYDLRSFLRRVDGQPLEKLPPLIVSVHTLLPEDHNGELEEVARCSAPSAWPYRALLAVTGVVWLVPLGRMIFRRLGRRKTPPKTAAMAKCSLADQLRPLVEAACSGGLSSAGQARLELLLLAHWRERLNLTGREPQEALARMREDPEAGDLLHHLENWLHELPGKHAVDVAAVLAPYRAAAPISEPGLYAVCGQVGEARR